MAGSWRRFALEAVFLAALAVASGLAGLSTAEIVGVMALGWLLTALVELLAWLLAARRSNLAAARAAAPAPSGEPPAVPAAPQAPSPDQEDTGEQEAIGPSPEPAVAERKRFWRRKSRAEPAEAEPQPQPPSHVRLIPRPEQEPPGDDPPVERAEGA
jgi:hypothetical protein